MLTVEPILGSHVGATSPLWADVPPEGNRRAHLSFRLQRKPLCVERIIDTFSYSTI